MSFCYPIAAHRLASFPDDEPDHVVRHADELVLLPDLEGEASCARGWPSTALAGWQLRLSYRIFFGLKRQSKERKKRRQKKSRKPTEKEDDTNIYEYNDESTGNFRTATRNTVRPTLPVYCIGKPVYRYEHRAYR